MISVLSRRLLFWFCTVFVTVVVVAATTAEVEGGGGDYYEDPLSYYSNKNARYLRTKYRYKTRRNDGEPHLLGTLLGLGIGFGLLICFWCCYAKNLDKSEFQMAVEEADSRVVASHCTTKKDNPMPTKKGTTNNGFLPMNGVYNATYTENDKSTVYRCKITMNFSPVKGGHLYKISGNGKDNRGFPIRLKDGRVSALSGEAYWLDDSGPGPVLNSGRFYDFDNHCFGGTWQTKNGVSGKYTSFQLDRRQEHQQAAKGQAPHRDGAIVSATQEEEEEEEEEEATRHAPHDGGGVSATQEKEEEEAARHAPRDGAVSAPQEEEKKEKEVAHHTPPAGVEETLADSDLSVMENRFCCGLSG